MQLDLFNLLISIESENLLNLLNEGRSKKEKYKLLPTIYNFGTINLLVAFNNIEQKFLFNIVDQEGKTPYGYTVNWRTCETIIREFPGKLIPEIIVRIRVTEINNKLMNDKKTPEEIERFWDKCFIEAKKREKNK